MTKNVAKIRAGLRALSDEPYEIISGTVVSGSVDSDEYTVSVQRCDDSEPIEGVRLSSVTSDPNGVILIPTDDSTVVIGSIDGPGEWGLIKTSDLEKMIVTIGNTKFTITDGTVKAEDGSGAEMTMTDGKFRIKNGSKDFKTVLDNILQHILALTVPTGTGPSGTPINAADITNDKNDIDSLFF